MTAQYQKDLWRALLLTSGWRYEFRSFSLRFSSSPTSELDVSIETNESLQDWPDTFWTMHATWNRAAGGFLQPFELLMTCSPTETQTATALVSFLKAWSVSNMSGLCNGTTTGKTLQLKGEQYQSYGNTLFVWTLHVLSGYLGFLPHIKNLPVCVPAMDRRPDPWTTGDEHQLLSILYKKQIKNRHR